MAADKPILVVGYGSIGRRHLRNLRALGHENLIVCRSGRGVIPFDEPESTVVETDLSAALAHEPRAAVIATPTSLHLDAAIAAAERGCHLLIEKPVSHSLAGVDELTRVADAGGMVVSIGFQFRFHPSLRLIKQWIDGGEIGAVVSAQAHWGEYLPGWHPWEDFRQSYSARPDLGGGVILTLCHPFDYLRWLVGEVRTVEAVAASTSGLGLDVEDVAQVAIGFENGAVGGVYLDYNQRPPEHSLRVVGEKGTIVWRNETGVAELFREKTAEWERFAPPVDFDRNEMFVDEMRDFLYSIDNAAAPACGLADGIRALEIALAAKRTAADRDVEQAKDSIHD